MRKYIVCLLFLPLVLTLSCSRELDLPETEGDLVVLNAILYTDEAQHDVFVSLSTREGDLPLNDAEVRCTVGSGPSIVAEKTENSRDKSTRFQFEAEIHPGDRVRIEAQYESFRATAEVTAPALPLPTTLDTLRADGWMQFALGVQERPEEAEYYQLQLAFRTHTEIDEYWRDTNPYPDYPEFEFTPGAQKWHSESDLVEPLPLNLGEDPILNDGYTPQSIIDKYYNTNAGFLFEFSPVNKTRIFSDHLFQAGSATVRFSTETKNFRMQDQHNRYGYDPWTRFHYRLTRQLIVRLMALDEGTWQYLGAINRVRETIGANTLLVEPVVIPTNVEGGLGFVGIASAAPIALEFPGVDNPDDY